MILSCQYWASLLHNVELLHNSANLDTRECIKSPLLHCWSIYHHYSYAAPQNHQEPLHCMIVQYLQGSDCFFHVNPFFLFRMAKICTVEEWNPGLFIMATSSSSSKSSSAFELLFCLDAFERVYSSWIPPSLKLHGSKMIESPLGRPEGLPVTKFRTSWCSSAGVESRCSSPR